MLTLNIYTVGKILLLLTSSIVVIVSAIHGKPVNIKKQLSFGTFIKWIIAAVCVNLIGILVYFLRGNFNYSVDFIQYIFYFFQYVVVTCYTVMIMTTWLRAYYPFFRKKIWAYMLVSLWIINEGIHIIPSVALFIILSICAVGMLKYRYRSKMKESGGTKE